MKKLMIVSALLLFAGITFGQVLHKGNLIGVHIVKIELKPGVTMDQFTEFFIEKMKPVWEEADKGVEIFPTKSIRGEQNNEFGMIVIYKNEAARDKNYNEDGSLSEYGNKVMEAVAPINAEAEKLGTWTSTYTDWVVL